MLILCSKISSIKDFNSKVNKYIEELKGLDIHNLEVTKEFTEIMLSMKMQVSNNIISLVAFVFSVASLIISIVSSNSNVILLSMLMSITIIFLVIIFCAFPNFRRCLKLNKQIEEAIVLNYAVSVIIESKKNNDIADKGGIINES